MRAELRSAARSFARALDMPEEWETDRLSLDFECMFREDHIAPSMDHTILPRARPLNPRECFGLFLTFEQDRRFAFPLDPPEYRPQPYTCACDPFRPPHIPMIDCP